MIARLDRFTELVWRSEPQDVQRLRQLSRPPMGRLPGIFYACFNLFWLGEEVQTLRDQAKAGSIDVRRAQRAARHALHRHAIRLSKWHLVDSLELLGDVANFTEAGGARTHDEFRELCEHLMLAADRLQAWVDRMHAVAHARRPPGARAVSDDETATEIGRILDGWEREGIRYVRFELPDLHGTARTKLVPIAAAATTRGAG